MYQNGPLTAVFWVTDQLITGRLGLTGLSGQDRGHRNGYHPQTEPGVRDRATQHAAFL